MSVTTSLLCLAVAGLCGTGYAVRVVFEHDRLLDEPGPLTAPRHQEIVRPVTLPAAPDARRTPGTRPLALAH